MKTFKLTMHLPGATEQEARIIRNRAFDGMCIALRRDGYTAYLQEDGGSQLVTSDDVSRMTLAMINSRVEAMPVLNDPLADMITAASHRAFAAV